MIFLDNDDEWILARDRQELMDVLLQYIDPDNDDHLLRIAAACLGCEKEEARWWKHIASSITGKAACLIDLIRLHFGF